MKQQETLNGLPKAMRSRIAHFLYFPIIEKAYLFNGVSLAFIFQVVAELQPEYFPPKEDVILQNQSPTDLYIIVSGAVEMSTYIEGSEQIFGRAEAGEVLGEIGLLCQCAQPYSARTTRLSQVLRLDKAALKNIIRENMEEGTIIMRNLLQKLRLHKGLYTELETKDPRLVLRELLEGVPSKVNQCSCPKIMKRVTIHMHSQKEIEPKDQIPKLIILPNSVRELLKIGGEKFMGHRPTKVVDQEKAEIEDISVVRDGDHLFLLETLECGSEL